MRPVDRQSRLTVAEQPQALCDWADGLLSFHTSLDSDTRDVLLLVTNLLYTEKFLLEHSRPRYVSYTNLRLLDRHLLEDQAVPLKAKWQAAKQTLALVIRDWHEKERDRLSAYLAGKGDSPKKPVSPSNALLSCD